MQINNRERHVNTFNQNEVIMAHPINACLENRLWNMQHTKVILWLFSSKLIIIPDIYF